MSMKKRLKRLLALFLAAVLCCIPSVAKAEGQGTVLLYIKTSSENLESGAIVTGESWNVLFDEPLDDQLKDTITVPEGCQLIGWKLWACDYRGCVKDDWTKQLAKNGTINQADISACMGAGSGINNMLIEPLFGAGEEIAVPQVAVPVITLDEEHVWKGFSGSIVFDNYFNKNKSLAITLEADDAAGSDESADAALKNQYDIFYYLADSKTAGVLLDNGGKIAAADKVEAAMEAKGLSWSAYEEAINLTEEGRYVLYVKLVDKEKRANRYASTGGIVIDKTAPKVFRTGAGENSELQIGAVYYGDVTFRVEDDNLRTVTLDGNEMFWGFGYKITADNKEHTIVAKDYAGNSKEYKISVYELWTLQGITKSGEYSLLPNIAYKLGNGTWRLTGDATVYYGSRSVYVSGKGKYSFWQH